MEKKGDDNTLFEKSMLKGVHILLSKLDERFGGEAPVDQKEWGRSDPDEKEKESTAPPGPLKGAVSGAAKKELAELEGVWERWEFSAVGVGWPAAEVFLHGGKNRIREPGNAPYPLEVKDGTFTFAGTAAGKATAKLDPTTSPKVIDLTDAKGRTWLGIYQLNDNKLVINLGLGEARPKRLKEIGTFGQAMVVYRRAKK